MSADKDDKDNGGKPAGGETVFVPLTALAAEAVHDQVRAKRHAARIAADMVEAGMIVGLGTGSTATFMVERLGERVRQGLAIKAIPTSNVIGQLAQSLGIVLTDFATHPVIDVAIDGADEVERGSLHLIKGLGGALLREKMVAAAAKRFIVIVDDSKPVATLGERTPVPVEVVPFGWHATHARLEKLGAQRITVRQGAGGMPFMTDNGNMVLDCDFGPIKDAAHLAGLLDRTVGVVEHGIFPDMATDVVVAREQEIEQWTRNPEPNSPKSRVN
ncbi:ribose-5-phosphate isomerase RpiA [Formicincola oecophyllae]|uniref:Ribose-5-phosphate isomerase A n=1 Tax=Formicincola oecophyllae TaxID=2558361 RepID=A0A4Y6UBL4_9PROT|nr:ribose-5-phosphate isomerase RpiA [Formicincola oecophyllae]QDH13791.1 ribose-5-phosphate isomerase RpiA [Formicincola oecophyllae]